MTTFADIPIDTIAVHPSNPRRRAVADDDMVRSIDHQGILVAVTIGAAIDGTHLMIAGHRRVDGARKAGLTTVPAMILDHLSTEAQQIEAMAVENLHREDLTPVEEAAAFEQLQLLGLSQKQISEHTGYPAATVSKRLKLVKLSAPAQDSLHVGQMTLDDASDLLALEERPDLLANVEKVLSTDDFAHELRTSVRQAERDKEWQAKREEYEARGLPEVKEPKGGWRYGHGVPRIAQSYNGDEDKADAWTDRGEHYGPALVITKESKPKKTKAELEHEAKRKKEAEERKQLDAANAAAKDLRLEHFATVCAGVKIPAGAQQLMRFAIGARIAGMTRPEQDAIAKLSGVELLQEKDSYRNHGIVRQLLTVSAPTLTKLLVAVMATEADGVAFVGFYENDLTIGLANGINYLDQLEDTGYPLPQIDKDLRDKYSKRLTDEETKTAAEDVS